MSATVCVQCGATWTGLRIEHCNACHETFTGTSSGDKHRTGRYDTTTGPDRRRCLSPSEMDDLGMARNKRGQWMSSQPTEAWWDK